MAEKSYKKICEFLDAVIAGRQKVHRREAWVLVALGFLAAFLLAPAAVVSQPYYGYSAIVYLGGTFLILVAALGRAFWVIKRPPKRENIALEIESELPDLGNNLISSLQLFPKKELKGSDDPTSPELIDALVLETGSQVEHLTPRSFVSDESPRRLGKLVTALGVTALAIGVVWPGLYPRAGFLLTHAVELMPSRITHLYLSASAKRILPDTEVDFSVRTEGREPDNVNLEFNPLSANGNQPNIFQVAMAASEKNRFRLKWKAGKEDVLVTARVGRFASAPVKLTVVSPPRAESVEVVNFPPEYTGLKPTKGSEEGHILAYLGSSVLVRAKTSKPVSEAVVALADGWKIPMKPGKEKYLEGLLLIGSPGSYQIRLKDGDGFSNLAPTRYRIDIIPDTPPVVEITEPSKDLYADAEDIIHLRYNVSDDFGVQAVHLEMHIGNKPMRRVRLWGGKDPEKTTKGVHVFDLRALGLQPGEALTYRVTAEDTDTISGPKRGASPFFKIRIRNRDAVIASLDKKLNEISDDLLNLLGDHLEDEVAPAGLDNRSQDEKLGQKREMRPGFEQKKTRPSLQDKAEKILDKVITARTMLRPNNPREALASMDLGTLAKRLRELVEEHLRPRNLQEDGSSKNQKQMKKQKDDMLARKEEATEAIERLASMGEDILRNLRMDRVGRTADEMMRRQQSLARTLEEMRRSGDVDERAKQRFEKELRALQQEMEKLMKQLAGLAQRMPSEFMNQRGMRNLPMQDMMQSFDKIRQQMRSGDVRGALDSLRRLMNQIQRMRNALRGLQRQQMQAQRGGRPMRRRQSELAAILKEQQAILDETSDVFDSVVQRLKKGWPKGVEELQSHYRKIIEQERSLTDKLQLVECEPDPSFSKTDLAEKWKEHVDEVRRERRSTLGELEGFSQKGEWGEVHRRLGQMERAIQNEPCVSSEEKKEQAAHWKGAKKWLDDLLRKAEKKSSPKERQSLKGLRERQKALEGRLAGITERVRRLMQLFPMIDPKVLSRLSEADAAMKKAEAHLGEHQASHAIPQEERVIELLAQGQQAMQQSMQQMAQRGSIGFGTPRGMGIFQAPGRGWWARNPNLPGQDISRQPGREGEDGQLGVDFSEVQIPDREQYKVPEKFREEVMEALKEGLPESLRQEIENYYERLTR